MPFDFLGSFNDAQYARFLAYARGQFAGVGERMLHLEAEQARVGVLAMKTDQGGNPLGIEAEPAESYLGKLFAAYKAVGGDPEYDLQIRAIDDPVYRLKTNESTPAQKMNNGEVMATAGQADAASALLIGDMRRWMAGSLRMREALERKIRRAVDYGDQLQAELDLLRVIQAEADVAGSLESLAAQVTELLDDPSYRAIYRSSGKDPFGRLSRAPFAGNEPGPGRPGPDEAVRTNKGVVEAGQESA